jgi:hypothetical protein
MLDPMRRALPRSPMLGFQNVAQMKASTGSGSYFGKEMQALWRPFLPARRRAYLHTRNAGPSDHDATALIALAGPHPRSRRSLPGRRSGVPCARRPGGQASAGAPRSNDRRRRRSGHAAGGRRATAGVCGAQVVRASFPDQIADGLMDEVRTHTPVSSPARCSRANVTASRRFVLTRSPGRFGIRACGTTTGPSISRHQAQPGNMTSSVAATRPAASAASQHRARTEPGKREAGDVRRAGMRCATST